MLSRRVVIVALFVSVLNVPATPVSAGSPSNASIVLHAAPAGGDNPCLLSPGTNFTPVTAAPVESTGGLGYYVYVIGYDPAWAIGGGIAGLQFGVDYGPEGPGDGVVINEWTSCGTLEFAAPGWPASGTGNLITWDNINSCQRQAYAVAGFFYLTAYSPSLVKSTRRPSDNAAKLASCSSQETLVYPGRLGWLSFGGATYNADDDGFDPVHEPPMFTSPILEITGPGEGAILGNTQAHFSWFVLDDVTPAAQLDTEWQIDSGNWQAAPAGGELTIPRLVSGPHVFRVRTADPQNQTAADSVSFEVPSGLDDFPATMILSQPADSPTGPYFFSWTGSDTETPTGSLRYIYVLREVLFGWCPRPTPELEYAVTATEVTFPSLPRGQYVLTVRAVDENGQVDPRGAQSRVVTVNRDPREFPACPPLVHITGEPDSLLIERPLTLQWRGFYGKGPHEDLRFAWRLDGSAWSNWQADSSLTVTFEQPGSHRIEVKARDTAGFESPHLGHVDWDIASPPAAAHLPMPIGLIPVRGIQTEVMITPNPSPAGISIRFGLSETMPVGYRVFDVRGRLVRESPRQELGSGDQQLEWDGREAGGRLAPAGVYYLELGAGSQRVMRTVSLVR